MHITEEKFEAATGHKPEQDDLERCNCKRSGQIGHQMCGWNSSTNLPVFMSPPQRQGDPAIRQHICR